VIEAAIGEMNNLGLRGEPIIRQARERVDQINAAEEAARVRLIREQNQSRECASALDYMRGNSTQNADPTRAREAIARAIEFGTSDDDPRVKVVRDLITALEEREATEREAPTVMGFGLMISKSI